MIALKKSAAELTLATQQHPVSPDAYAEDGVTLTVPPSVMAASAAAASKAASEADRLVLAREAQANAAAARAEALAVLASCASPPPRQSLPTSPLPSVEITGSPSPPAAPESAGAEAGTGAPPASPPPASADPEPVGTPLPALPYGAAALDGGGAELVFSPAFIGRGPINVNEDLPKSPAAPAATKFCQHCGAPFQTGARFCGGCGLAAPPGAGV